jgi:hypothetical protein
MSNIKPFALGRCVCLAVTLLFLHGCNIDSDDSGVPSDEDSAGINAGTATGTGSNSAGDRTLTISWQAPSAYEDGSDLVDLSAYRIYYGRVSGQYENMIEVQHSGASSVVVGDLSPGTYYVAMSSINSDGIESGLSYEVSRTVL